jgi:aspartyl-tRNA(Asn)/glutamyl-tRNA(Gln) amidotransferase subunit A
MQTITALASALQASHTTSESLVDESLARIADPDGEGSRTFLETDDAGARSSAAHVDAGRRGGQRVPRFAGIPISVKDLFDVRGQVTRAGSRILAADPPADADAPAIARLRQAGFVIVGRTNMTEFAYSALGLNPHYGTPKNAWDRDSSRVPGGSSSGAAVSVTDRMAVAALGSDTGGSCRIPAALCGIVGVKPTASRIPRERVVPLSTTLDTVGVLANSVECAGVLFDVLAGGDGTSPVGRAPSALRIAVPSNYMLDELDAAVAAAFDASLDRLSAAGARVTFVSFPMFNDLPSYNAKGGFSGAESYRWHRRFLDAQRERYDPRVLERILRGAEQSPADYAALVEQRQAVIASVNATMLSYDVMAFPTTPIVAPAIADVATDADRYRAVNAQLLRNSSVVNFFDGCAISIPIHEPGRAPVGLTFASVHGDDEAMLGWALGAEALFRK